MQRGVFFGLVFFLASLSTMYTVSLASDLEVGFYRSTCPAAEHIIRRVVNDAIFQNPGLGAGLIRMHFHDCFVRGCDASVLLDSTPGNPAEKEHPANNPSLRGYEVIDNAKLELEYECPQTVSCADIIAFAARDSASRLGGIDYEVPAGRRDGLISLKDDVNQNIPAFFFNLQQLRENFTNKGLSLEEMVTLSGAHSIGVSHCSSFSNRLYSFNNVTNQQDPSLDLNFADDLKPECPNEFGPDNPGPTVNLDYVTPYKLDNMYYKNLLHRRVLLTSDQALMTSRATVNMVWRFSRNRAAWERKFAEAMVRMGSIEVLTGDEGEIRRNCRVVNSYY